jgi:hypothetical protein
MADKAVSERYSKFFKTLNDLLDEAEKAWMKTVYDDPKEGDHPNVFHKNNPLFSTKKFLKLTQTQIAPLAYLNRNINEGMKRMWELPGEYQDGPEGLQVDKRYKDFKDAMGSWKVLTKASKERQTKSGKTPVYNPDGTSAGFTGIEEANVKWGDVGKAGSSSVSAGPRVEFAKERRKRHFFREMPPQEGWARQHSFTEDVDTPSRSIGRMKPPSEGFEGAEGFAREPELSILKRKSILKKTPKQKSALKIKKVSMKEKAATSKAAASEKRKASIPRKKRSGGGKKKTIRRKRKRKKRRTKRKSRKKRRRRRKSRR